MLLLKRSRVAFRVSPTRLCFLKFADVAGMVVGDRTVGRVQARP